MKEIKNLLIHAPNWLGDIVMSLPAIHLIKEEYEDIKITVLAKKSMFGILTVSGLVDDVNIILMRLCFFLILLKVLLEYLLMA